MRSTIRRTLCTTIGRTSLGGPLVASPPAQVGKELWRRSSTSRGFTTESLRIFMLLNEEIGEVARELKKAWSPNYGAQDQHKLAEELADCLVVLCALASAHEIDLEAAVNAKFFEKDSERQWSSAAQWPPDYADRLSGASCALCAEGRPEETRGRIRFCEGELSDAYLHRWGVQRGFAAVIWRGGHAVEPTALSDQGQHPSGATRSELAGLCRSITVR
jgi:NTP pyrophosphatase (non-canonical NTP hydrolase)